MTEAKTQGWVRACPLAEVPEDGAVRVELGKRNAVAIVRAEGEVFAIRDVCSHAEVPLSEGDIDGTTIECWLHGSRFDLRTGTPTGPPATKPVPVYPTMIDGDDVFVRIEEK
jgi:3-phenylpropionate/trans-cinnamate dioxygenase ferredoxin component